MKKTLIACLAAFAVSAPTVVLAFSSAPVQAHTTGIHDNCTNFNNKYPHGVGRRGAVDRGGNVTNFKRSNRIYNRAERHNGDLDRDNDKIACEKA
ncbi:excalibur calcium-binding domain-containing protein [Nocardioides antri]|uniref:Excalibur calcium-binding domain-containing protein n=1 Tax=Nocardioides antri TaxID=2607659 RepID=A0A5B1LTW9_9ACTN|nr:excalibur calcium-binding domain-containing protein [Nocardioides antri]KAA1424113.1 excalibur calcium-binding domain-containing protein [Nocardioides antri]